MFKLHKTVFEGREATGSVVPVLIVAFTVLGTGTLMIKYQKMQRENASRLVNLSSLKNVGGVISKYLDCAATLDGNGINAGNLAAMCPSTATNLTPPYIALYRTAGGAPQPITGPLDNDGFGRAGEWLLRSVCSQSAQKVLIFAKPFHAKHEYQGREQILFGPTAGLCTTEINDLVGGPNPPVGDLRINGSDTPPAVNQGSSVTISWDSTDATDCTLNPLGLNGTSNVGTFDGPLMNDKTYRLTCVNGPLVHEDIISVTVNPPPSLPTASLQINGSGNDLTVNDGSTIEISWTSTNASDGCTVGAPVNWTGTSNPGQNFGPLSTGTYTIVLTCSNVNGSATDEIDVTVSPSVPSGTVAVGGFLKSTNPLKFVQSWTIQVSVDPAVLSLDFYIYDLSNNKISNTTMRKSGGGAPTLTTIPETDFITLPVLGNQYKVCDDSLVNCSGPVTAALMEHTLLAAEIVGSNVRFDYSIRHFTCGYLLAADMNPWPTTVECVGPAGPSMQYLVPLANFKPGFGVGSQVWMRHGNDMTPISGPVTVTGPPPTADLKVDGSNGPLAVPSGTSVSLSWSSTNATGCTVTPGGLSGLSNAGTSVTVTVDTDFELSCTNGSDTVTDTVQVNIAGSPSPTADLKVNGGNGPISVNPGDTVMLSWTSTNTTSCSVTPGSFPTSKNEAGTSSGPIVSNTTYTLTCNGPGGTATDSVTVNVLSSPVVADIKANGSDGPIIVVPGGPVYISWYTEEATSCSVSPGGWSGLFNHGRLASRLSNGDSVTYLISCTGPSGSATDSVSVSAAGPPMTIHVYVPQYDNHLNDLDANVGTQEYVSNVWFDFETFTDPSLAWNDWYLFHQLGGMVMDLRNVPGIDRIHESDFAVSGDPTMSPHKVCRWDESNCTNVIPMGYWSNELISARLVDGDSAIEVVYSKNHPFMTGLWYMDMSTRKLRLVASGFNAIVYRRGTNQVYRIPTSTVNPAAFSPGNRNNLYFGYSGIWTLFSGPKPLQ